MKKYRKSLLAALWAAFFCIAVSVKSAAAALPFEELHALSAVLMDAESGRILYSKDGYTARPMASTTKVMTCILALERAAGDDYVQVSAYAQSQPEVKLGLKEGEQYYLEDLLYSLMLKSHNDTAVAVAEHIAGSCEAFAEMMNQKAEELGCADTHFITPNGLDAEDSGGVHRTTAADLGRIMCYAIQNPVFLKITQTREYSFSELTGKKRYTVVNTNALFDLTDGVISGKTGFTGNAGYCYVCACEKDGKTFVVALLGCGWPGNKGYKWKDTLKLLEYGRTNYSYRRIPKAEVKEKIPVKRGAKNLTDLKNQVYLSVSVRKSVDSPRTVLMRSDEQISCRTNLPLCITAPVKKGTILGRLDYYIGEEYLLSDLLCASENIGKITYEWCVRQLFSVYFP